jgi:hypothetical protein
LIVDFRSAVSNRQSSMKYRGVSSTVKLSVSKTELGGSNPSAPARLWKSRFGSTNGRQKVDGDCG